MIIVYQPHSFKYLNFVQNNCIIIVKKYLWWHCQAANHFPAQCRGLMMSLQYGLAKSFCGVTQWGGEGLFHSFWVISKMCGPANSTADHWAAVMPTTETVRPSLRSFRLYICIWGNGSWFKLSEDRTHISRASPFWFPHKWQHVLLERTPNWDMFWWRVPAAE